MHDEQVAKDVFAKYLSVVCHNVRNQSAVSKLLLQPFKEMATEKFLSLYRKGTLTYRECEKEAIRQECKEIEKEHKELAQPLIHEVQANAGRLIRFEETGDIFPSTTLAISEIHPEDSVVHLTPQLDKDGKSVQHKVWLLGEYYSRKIPFLCEKYARQVIETKKDVTREEKETIIDDVYSLFRSYFFKSHKKVFISLVGEFEGTNNFLPQVIEKVAIDTQREYLKSEVIESHLKDVLPEIVNEIVYKYQQDLQKEFDELRQEGKEREVDIIPWIEGRISKK